MAMIPIYKGDPKLFRMNLPSNYATRRQECGGRTRVSAAQKRKSINGNQSRSLPVHPWIRNEKIGGSTENGSPPLGNKFFCFHDVHRTALATILEAEENTDPVQCTVMPVAEHDAAPKKFDASTKKTSIYCGTIASHTVWDKMVHRLTNVLGSSNSRYELRRHGGHSADSSSAQPANATLKPKKNIYPDAHKYLEAEVSPLPFGAEKRFQSRW